MKHGIKQVNCSFTQRKNARQFAIVVTDGQCTHDYLPLLYKNAAALRGGDAISGKAERIVWSIGVGEADMEELRTISGHPSLVLGIKDFSKIKEIKEVSLSQRGQ